MPPVFPTSQLTALASLDQKSHSHAPYPLSLYPSSKAMASVPPEASWVPLPRMYAGFYTHSSLVM